MVSPTFCLTEELPLPPRHAATPPLPGTAYGAMAGRWNNYAVQRMLGREPRRNFSHLPEQALSPWSLWNYFVVGIVSNVVAAVREQMRARG